MSVHLVLFLVPLELAVLMLFRTDIEQEANGLYSFDRNEKLSSEKVKAIINESLALWYKGVEQK